MRRHFPTISNGLVARRLSAPGSGRTSRRRALTCTCVALLLNLLACGPALALLSVGNSLGCKYAKIQDAIDAAAQTDIIDVEPNTYAEHLLITDKSLQIRACACADVVCVTKSHAVVDGSTTIKNLKPLLRIQTTGSNSITVDLTNIEFVNNDSVIDGGGIAWAAQGQLTLNNASVAGNTALNGGGIYFNGIGTGTAATLVFGNNVSISSNTATGSGGGLRIEGLSSFLMDGSNDRVFGNTADSDGNGVGDGGGISIVSPATAHVGTAVSANAAIHSNTGYNGGGIAFIGSSVDSGSSTDSTVTILGSDSQLPVRIESNTATHWGGGVYLRPKVFDSPSSSTNRVTLSATGYRIDANKAFDGSAIYADTDSSPALGAWGGIVQLYRSTCPVLVECNTIAGNLFSAFGIGGTPASVIVVRNAGQLFARYVRMHDNAGEYLLQSFGAKAYLGFSLVYGNHVADAVIAGESGNQQLQIVQDTIAGNTIEGAQVISGSFETLNNSLIDQPGTAAFVGSGTPVVFNVVATDADGLPTDPTIEQQAPLFVDAASDDFRLLVQRLDNGTVTASPGVDYAAAGLAQLDIGARFYDQDIPGFGAAGDVRDLGAFEMQPITDRLFASGFGDPVVMAN